MTLEIPLNHNKIMLIEEADYQAVRHLKIAARLLSGTHWYAGFGKGKFVHRVIMRPADDQFIDHINGNGLDNRRCNLRICTHKQNMWNTRRKPGCSGFRGVHLRKKEGHWQAQIQVSGKKIHLGTYLLKEEAARAYDTAAKQFFGPFARLNFPVQSSSSVQVLSCTGDETQCRPVQTEDRLRETAA